MKTPYSYIEKKDLIYGCYGYIYMTINTANGMSYIGARTNAFAACDKSYLGGSPLLKKDVKLYGRDSFKKYIITEGFYTPAFLGELEKHYVRLYNADKDVNFYNQSAGGDLDMIAFRYRAYEITRKPVFVFSKDGILLKKYDSIAECAKGLKLSTRTIGIKAAASKWLNSLKCYISLKENFDTAKASPPKYTIYDIDNNKVEAFHTQTECAVFLNCTLPQISESIYHNRWLRRKYQVRHFDESIVGLPGYTRAVKVTKNDEVIQFKRVKDAALFFAEKFGFKGNVTPLIINRIKCSRLLRGYKIEYNEERNSCGQI